MDKEDQNNLFMDIALLFGSCSTCPRGKVGAVIVREGRIISTGYNGAPPNMPHCEDIGCEYELVFGEETEFLGCQRVVHAEANAIAWAARQGISVFEATMYCTYSPCKKCAYLMSSAGIKCVIYRQSYDRTPWEIMSSLGIEAKSI